MTSVEAFEPELDPEYVDIMIAAERSGRSHSAQLRTGARKLPPGCSRNARCDGDVSRGQVKNA